LSLPPNCERGPSLPAVPRRPGPHPNTADDGGGQRVQGGRVGTQAGVRVGVEWCGACIVLELLTPPSITTVAGGEGWRQLTGAWGAWLGPNIPAGASRAAGRQIRANISLTAYARTRTAGWQSLMGTLDAQYKGSKVWRAAYKAAPQSACKLKGSDSLCSSEGGAGVDRYAQLVLASSPTAYSSLDGRWTGGRMLLAAVREQGDCDTCVAHAVVQAAEVRARQGLPGGSLQPGCVQPEPWHYWPAWAKGVRAGVASS
jgi:hypothetical protein